MVRYQNNMLENVEGINCGVMEWVKRNTCRLDGMVMSVDCQIPEWQKGCIRCVWKGQTSHGFGR